MKRLAAAALCVAAAIILTACSAISAGYVTEKEYSPAYTYPVTYCAMYNAKSMCTMWMTRQEYVPERFTLRLVESKDLLDRDRKTGWAVVSQSTYDSYEIGDWFPRESEQ